MNETEFIARFLQSAESNDSSVVLDIGDDAAVVNIPAGNQLVVSTDSLLSDVHFFHDQEPESIAHKALHVNLSDIAAMGASPEWVTLNLHLPDFDPAWMTRFSKQLFATLNATHVSLIGGDLCCGPLAVSFTALGLVPVSQYLSRSTANIGDNIFVSGYLGDAALALSIERDVLQQASYQAIRNKLLYPTARTQLGLALSTVANSMIDISDGLYQDLSRMMQASVSGAEIYTDKIPLSATMQKTCESQQAIRLALSGGDDYELCFTAAPEKNEEIMQMSRELQLEITCIGKVVESEEVKVLDENKRQLQEDFSGYDHVSSTASLVIS